MGILMGHYNMKLTMLFQILAQIKVAIPQYEKFCIQSYTSVKVQQYYFLNVKVKVLIMQNGIQNYLLLFNRFTYYLMFLHYCY